MASVAHQQGVDVADIEVWFEDEARVGQKNKITRRWARRGSRPSAPSDQRTASAYIFGAICPAQGQAAGLVLPWCNTEAMNLQLAAVSAKVKPGRHAVLLLDQAGWHMTPKLAVPGNISIIPLPAKCPELNPQEGIWQFIRQNWLSTGSSPGTKPSSITAVSMEQARAAAMDHHVHRLAQLGTRVLIRESWY